MSAAVVATGAQANATGTSIAVPYPAGFVAGNVLVCFVSSNTVASWGPTPAGWTNDGAEGVSGIGFVAFHKVSDGTESGTLAVTVPSGTWHGVMVALSGVATSGTYFYTHADFGSAAGSTSFADVGHAYFTNPSASTRRIGLAFAQAATTTTTWSAEALSSLTGVSITELQDANGQLVAFATATGGSSSAFTATLSASDDARGIIYDLVEDIAPSAPTLGTVTTIDPTVVNRFSWVSHDADDGDGAQFGFDLSFSSDGGSTWPIGDSGSYYYGSNYDDVAAGTLTAGTWEWRVRTYDKAGQVGPYATSGSFTAVVPTPPNTPTVLCTPNTSDGSITVVATHTPNNILDVDTASFEGGLGTWVAVTNCVVTQSTTQALDGTHSMRMASVAAGDMVAQTGMIPVSAATQYAAAIRARAGATGRSVQLQWWNYDAALNSLGGTFNFANDTTSGWTPVTLTPLSSPTGAKVQLTVTVKSTGGASELHYIDEVDVHLGTTTAFLASTGIPGVTAADVHRRLWNDGTDGIRIAAGLPVDAAYSDYRCASRTAYQYRAVARTAVDTVTAASVWSPA